MPGLPALRFSLSCPPCAHQPPGASCEQVDGSRGCGLHATKITNSNQPGPTDVNRVKSIHSVTHAQSGFESRPRHRGRRLVCALRDLSTSGHRLIEIDTVDWRRGWPWRTCRDPAVM